MKFFIVVFFASTAILLLNNCDSTEPKPEPELLLKLEDVSCTEAWLQFKTTNLQLPNNITLFINDLQEKTFNLTEVDTLLHIDSLLPNQNYSFQIINFYNPEDGVKSNKVNTTTMDTTSHNFTWQTFTFGEHQHSVLYDVAVIDENNIWAVGEIYMNDSLGNPDLTPYNSIHWDGNDWEIIRIPTKTFSGSIVSSQIKTIFSFSENNIWTFSISGSYSNWNGSIWKTEFVNERDGNGTKFWGINSSSLFLVCNNGGISFYNGTNWTKIESGTTVNLLDIWGTPDENTIWTCGYSDDYANTVLIRIKDGVAEKIYEGSSNGQSNGYYIGPMSGVWTDNDHRVFLMNGGGIYIQENNSRFFLEKEIARFSHGSYGIDGTRSNNVFACGDEFVGHWNGNNYFEYPELSKQLRMFFNVSTKGNIVCAVGTDYNGYINSNAIIALGKK